MPNFDGTGPQGKGSMTGMKRGNCQSDEKPVGGRGCFGRGNGRSLGRGCMRGQGRNFGKY